jgi:hypothetical protein
MAPSRGATTTPRSSSAFAQPNTFDGPSGGTADKIPERGGSGVAIVQPRAASPSRRARTSASTRDLTGSRPISSSRSIPAARPSTWSIGRVPGS